MSPRIVLVAASLMLFTAFAQVPSWGQAADSRPGVAYNANTEQVVRGVVEAIGGQSSSHLLAGDHLTLLASGAKVDVHLGPGEPRRLGNYGLRVGDQVEVTGGIVVIEGKPVLLARTVKRGNQVLTFRNRLGIPVISPDTTGRAGLIRPR